MFQSKILLGGLAGLVAAVGLASAQDFQPVAPMYHDGSAVHATLRRWAQLDREWLVLHEFGSQPEGRVLGLELGAPGTQPLDERRVMWVFGGMDGLSLVGAEAALQSAYQWLGQRDCLPQDVSIIVVPWASPAELQAILSDGPQANLADGRDMDGDGLVLEMLTEDPAGLWVRAKDQRFLVPATARDSRRLRHSVEGGQSVVGQVAGLQACFPGGDRWGSAQWLNTGQAIADAILARDTAAVVVLAGTGAQVGMPASLLDADREIYERLVQCWGGACTEAQPTSALDESSSAFLNWCYRVAEVPAVELRLWQPLGKAGAHEGGASWGIDNPLTADDRRWASWLDEELGGFGFVEWRPVDTGDGKRAWVGGWRERTRFNPPENQLEGTVAPVADFLAEWLDELPRLEIALVEVSRDRDLCRLVVELRSQGGWPLAPACSGRWSGGDGLREPWLRLELPPGVLRLARPESCALPELRGGGPARFEWLVSAPQASTFVLSAEAPGATTVQRRMQP